MRLETESGKSMKIIRNIAVTFSLYSRIPMPHFTWKDDDMKHNLVFLPWVGGVIGLISVLIQTLFGYFLNTDASANDFGNPLCQIIQLALFSLIPLLVTGGFHMDGFLDVEDALKSYKSKEEKLQILKDPHIGAFAVIRLLIYILIWIPSMEVAFFWGSDGKTSDRRSVVAYGITFFLVRAAAGLSSLLFTHAKKDGMLNMETEKAKRGDVIFLWAELFAAVAALLIFGGVKAGVFVIAGISVFTMYYKWMTEREFGGVTGDTTGYYIVMSEGIALLFLAMSRLIVWK